MNHPDFFEDNIRPRRASQKPIDPFFSLDSEHDVPAHIIAKVNQIHPVSETIMTPAEMQLLIADRRDAITVLLEQELLEDDDEGFLTNEVAELEAA